MLQRMLPLHRMQEGQRGTVEIIRLQGAVLQRILDLGLTEGCPVRCRLRSPAGGPIAYEIRGAVIALRRQDASKILVRLE